MEAEAQVADFIADGTKTDVVVKDISPQGLVTSEEGVLFCFELQHET
jgi:hypothetical protein